MYCVYCTVLYCTIVLYCIILYCIIIVLYSIVLYCSVLYYIIIVLLLYCVTYCTCTLSVAVCRSASKQKGDILSRCACDVRFDVFKNV